VATMGSVCPRRARTRQHGRSFRGANGSWFRRTLPLVTRASHSRPSGHSSQQSRQFTALVIDATGVGAGLSSLLADQLGNGPRRVIVEPFVSTGKSKSDLGWAFVGLIDGGRIKEYVDDGTDMTRIYRHQLAACTY
jgi:hypothetical protein